MPCDGHKPKRQKKERHRSSRHGGAGMGQPIDTATVEILPDFRQFSRELKAGVDAALRQVVREVDRAFGQVEAAAGLAGREVGRDFQAGGERAELALREVATQAKSSMTQVAVASEAAGKSVGGKLSAAAGVAKTALLGMSVAVAAALAATVGFGLKSAASMEQTTIGIQALVGSVQDAQKFIAELQSFAATTPFEFAGVADASRRILAFGNAVGITRDQVIPTLTTIGDLVSVLGGTQENIDAVVRAMGQIASTGHLMGGDLMQIAQALPGFDVHAAIAAKLGVSVADAMKMQEAGTIDAKTAIDALLQGMAKFPGAAGAMEKQSQTLSGVFSTFKDTISIALTNAFQPVIPQIKQTLTDITPILGAAVGQLAPVLGEALGALLPLIGSLISGLVPIVAPIVHGLAEGLALIGPILKPLGEALGHVARAIAPLLPVVGKLIAMLASGLAPVIDAVGQVLDILAPVLGQVVEAMLPLIPPVLELVIALTPLLVMLAKLLAWSISISMKNGAGVMLKGLAIAVDYLARALGAFFGWLGSIDWKSVGNAVGGFFVSLWDKIKLLWDLLTKFPEVARLAFEMTRAAVAEKIGETVAYVEGIPKRVRDALAGLGTLLIDKGRQLIAGLWEGISSMGGWLVGKIKGFVDDKIVGPVKDFLQIGSPSMVMADEVGEPMSQGVGVGFTRGLPGLQELVGSIVPGQPAAPHPAAAGAVGPISVTVVFSGVVPTEEQARRTGAAAGAGVADALRRRSMGLAVRTA